MTKKKSPMGSGPGSPADPRVRRYISRGGAIGLAAVREFTESARLQAEAPEADVELRVDVAIRAPGRRFNSKGEPRW